MINIIIIIIIIIVFNYTVLFVFLLQYIKLFLKGYDNGDVKLFDLRTQSMRFETNVNNGVTNIEFDRKDIEMNKMVFMYTSHTIHTISYCISYLIVSYTFFNFTYYYMSFIF